MEETRKRGTKVRMSETKINYVVDIELSLTLEEVTNLKELADKTKSTVDVVARDCMNEKCKELLNKPDVVE